MDRYKPHLVHWRRGCCFFLAPGKQSGSGKASGHQRTLARRCGKIGWHQNLMGELKTINLHAAGIIGPLKTFTVLIGTVIQG
jgi:hypothetical protein